MARRRSCSAQSSSKGFRVQKGGGSTGIRVVRESSPTSIGVRRGKKKELFRCCFIVTEFFVVLSFVDSSVSHGCTNDLCSNQHSARCLLRENLESKKSVIGRILQGDIPSFVCSDRRQGKTPIGNRRSQG